MICSPFRLIFEPEGAVHKCFSLLFFEFDYDSLDSVRFAVRTRNSQDHL